MIGFIGLGAMGSRIARRLLDAGHTLIVWNRTASRAAPLAEAGARVARTPAEAAAEAELVFTMVTDPAALHAVAEGPEGVLAGIRPGSLFVDMSTVGPQAIRELEPKVLDGVGFADSPVLGSISEAEHGTLKIFVGGNDDVFRRIRPVLSQLGDPLHMGTVGSGAAAKLVANSTLFDVLCALGEAIALGERLGLRREEVFEILAATPLAEQAERRRAAIESDDYPPRFKLSLAHKDAELVVAAAKEAGLDVRLGEAARSWLADAEAAGLGELDYSGTLKVVLRGR